MIHDPARDGAAASGAESRAGVEHGGAYAVPVAAVRAATTAPATAVRSRARAWTTSACPIGSVSKAVTSPPRARAASSAPASAVTMNSTLIAPSRLWTVSRLSSNGGVLYDQPAATGISAVAPAAVSVTDVSRSASRVVAACQMAGPTITAAIAIAITTAAPASVAMATGTRWRGRRLTSRSRQVGAVPPRSHAVIGSRGQAPVPAGSWATKTRSSSPTTRSRSTASAPKASAISEPA